MKDTMLTFIRKYSRVKSRDYGLYSCSCGGKIVTRMDSVQRGDTTSCGCLRAYNASKLYLKRGQNVTFA